MCKDLSIWTIDCRRFDDPDNDRSMRNHIGRNPKITKSILESGNYHALHDRLYDGMHRVFSDKNIVIMECRSGRHRSVANAEWWSNTLTRCGRRQHSVSLLHMSELDFGEICKVPCSQCAHKSRSVVKCFQFSSVVDLSRQPFGPKETRVCHAIGSTSGIGWLRRKSKR